MEISEALIFEGLVESRSVEGLAAWMKARGASVREAQLSVSKTRRRRPLDIAARGLWAEGVQALLDAGCPPSGRSIEEQSWSAAERAVFAVGPASGAAGGSRANEAWRILEMLREAGADLSAGDDEGITLLMLSVGRMSVGQVMELAEASNIRALDSSGDGVLHYCLCRREPSELMLGLIGRLELNPHGPFGPRA